MIDDAVIAEQYVEVQRIGFRVKVVCIRCGAVFDLDDLNLCFQHKEICGLLKS
jgi:hypothetical protein